MKSKFLEFRANLVMNTVLKFNNGLLVKVTKDKPLAGTVVGSRTKKIGNNNVLMYWFKPDGNEETFFISSRNFKKITC
jgi:hypothetical protein